MVNPFIFIPEEKKIKKILALLLAAMICTSLAACGESSVQGTTGTKQTTTETKEENNNEYVAYTFNGEPTDPVTVEEVTLKASRGYQEMFYMALKIKARNTSGRDLLMNESHMEVWYRYLDENKDILLDSRGNGGYFSTIKDGQATWIETGGFPQEWDNNRIESVEYIEIYGYNTTLQSSVENEFKNPILIPVKDFIDWEKI